MRRFVWHRGQPKCSSSSPAIGDWVQEVGVLMVWFGCNRWHITLKGNTYRQYIEYTVQINLYQILPDNIQNHKYIYIYMYKYLV